MQELAHFFSVVFEYPSPNIRPEIGIESLKCRRVERKTLFDVFHSLGKFVKQKGSEWYLEKAAL